VIGQQGQDPEILRDQAYADDTHLDIRRRTHQLYTMNPVDFGRWTLEQLAWRGDERVLDVGCGPGDLLREMARRNAGWDMLVGFDFSPGMVVQAAGSAAGMQIHFFLGDVQVMPLSDHSFGVVMARHMLYHVPDIERAIAECARVLRPGGRFLATTNSAHSMPEYQAIRERAASHFPAMTEPEMSTARFSLEDAAAYLRPHLERVESRTLPGKLRFPTAQPFVDYFASSRAMTMHPNHTDAEWQAVLDFVRAEVEAAIARVGHFDITKITGAVVGTKGG
jgi:ubiquinone/menaquinone biosynthesis C-methylase UbiE